MSAAPDAEEMRLRDSLRDLGVSHTPVAPEEDWWFALYGDRSAPGKSPASKIAPPRVHSPDDDSEAWEEITDPTDPATAEARVGVVRKGGQQALGWAQGHADLVQHLERRMRWVISTAAAAGIGWGVGFEQMCRACLNSCQHDTGSQVAASIVGAALVALGAWGAYRARRWWPPLAWTCRIPFASALLALCLYAPGAAS